MKFQNGFTVNKTFALLGDNNGIMNCWEINSFIKNT